MLMKPNEFKTFLEQLDVQVFYNHTTTDDVVEYPYIVFLDDNWSSFFASNITYYETIPYIVILHAMDRDYDLERRIKRLFTQNCIPYTLNDVTWNSEYMFWQVSFNVELI